MDFTHSTLLVIAALVSCVLCSDSISRATPFEGKLSFLRSDAVRNFFDSRERFLPLEGSNEKCRILTALYRNAQSSFNSREQRILNSRMRKMLETCPRGEFRMADLLNQTFIFPGTKWCGQGNSAENFHDLGVFNETDACCRDHDFCEDIIQSGRTKHNLINPYGTTRLHCKCDEALRQCFRKINSMVSNTVGYIFFSLLQTQCFDFDFPTTGCALWRRGAVRVYCVKYAFDETQPKKWQWFDQETYF